MGSVPASRSRPLRACWTLSRPSTSGCNYWYLARKPTYTAVLKVRSGVVEELGIATNALTKTRNTQSVLMRSFY